MPGDVGNLIGLRRRSRGNTFLLSRAKDANGEVQPDKHDENYATYVIYHLLPIEVTVEAEVNANS